MAKQHGVAGEWARVRGTVLSLWPLFLSFVMLGAFLASLCYYDQFTQMEKAMAKLNSQQSALSSLFG